MVYPQIGEATLTIFLTLVLQEGRSSFIATNVIPFSFVTGIPPEEPIIISVPVKPHLYIESLRFFIHPVNYFSNYLSVNYGTDRLGRFGSILYFIIILVSARMLRCLLCEECSSITSNTDLITTPFFGIIATMIASE